MNRLIAKVLVTIVFFFSCAMAAFSAETYNIDPQHTYVLWRVTHFGYSVQVGKIVDVTGTIIIDETKPQNSKVTVNIPMNNVITGVPKLDDHLKSEDFFETAKYPDATFVSDKITVTGKNTAKIHGMLTFRGVTKPIVLNATMLKKAMHPMKNVQTIGFNATATINRSEFGLSKFKEALSNDVKLDIGVEATLAS